MSVENFDKIFQPKSIAVVGTGEKNGSIVMLQQIPSRLPRRPDFDRLNLFRPKVCIDDFSHP